MKTLLTLFIFLFSTLVFFASGQIEAEDGWLYTSLAKNIYYEHRFETAPNEYPIWNVHFNAFLTDGKWKPAGSIGYSLTLLPAVFFSDLVHQYFNNDPVQHFPLEHDWSLHFFGSFTNIILASILGCLLYEFARLSVWTKRESIWFVLLTIFSTNLFSQAKSSFAHVLFTTLFVAILLVIKYYAVNKSWKLIPIAVGLYISLVFSYNITHFLTIPPIILYFILTVKPKFTIKKLLITFLILSVVGLVFIKKIIYMSIFLVVKPVVLFEGVWGFLFSPGKSIFIFSPLLLLIVIFWHKIQKKYWPELATFGLLLIIYLYFLGSPWIGSLEGKMPIWHGGINWGPRYLTAIIPLGLFNAFAIMRDRGKGVILATSILAVLGICIQLLGILLPYRMQYAALPFNTYIGKNEFMVFDYASFIPRYSAPLKSLEQLSLVLAKVPQTIDRSKYNVRFYQGFDMPLSVGNATYRGFRDFGWIAITPTNQTEKLHIRLKLLNAPDNNISTSSAQIVLKTPTQELARFDLKPNEDATLAMDFEPKGNKEFINVTSDLKSPSSVPHVIYIKELFVNGVPINLGSLDLMDGSSLNTSNIKMPFTKLAYVPEIWWENWHFRARVDERTLDLWWIKNLYYFDKPQLLLWSIFGINLGLWLYSSSQLWQELKQKN